MRQPTSSHEHFTRTTAVARDGGGARQGWSLLWCCTLFASCCLWTGCATTEFVTVRPTPSNALANTLNLLDKSGPKVTPRTEQYLRRYDLNTLAETDSQLTLKKLQDILERDPSPDACEACAELAYLGGLKLQETEPKEALNLFGAAVTHSYYYLFDPRFSQYRNPYDPQFRQVCDLYNQALESSLRLLHKDKKIHAACSETLKIGDHSLNVKIEMKNGPWSVEEIESIEFTSDYEVNGLPNKYRTFGLGVPLIVNRKPVEPLRPSEKYHPPHLSFPMTAFLRLLPDEEGSHAHQTPQAGTTCKRHRAVLELYDPLTGCDIPINDRLVPLQTDLSTPLAYFLNNPVLTKWDLPSTGFFDPEETSKYAGLYMLEPYNPQKIPVVFVHGLWSSPMTWMEMFNDLQGSPELRQRYQFWFYLYPTGQPFWDSAVALRKDLAELRKRLDPQEQSATIEQMVLVGHSMGGLLAHLQTIDSDDNFWKLVSDKPFNQLKGSPETQQQLHDLFYFQANPSLKRVVTIGTPHRGSDVSNNYTQWLGRKLISIPAMLANRRKEVLKENPDLFTSKELFGVATSIESLSPKNRVLPVLLTSSKKPWVTYHNIVGRLPQTGIYAYRAEGDGVVDYTSARFPDAASEIEVPADHVNVHRHPLSVLEVRRILLEHKQSMPIVGPWKRAREMPNPTALQPRGTDLGENKTQILPAAFYNPAMNKKSTDPLSKSNTDSHSLLSPPMLHQTGVHDDHYGDAQDRRPMNPGLPSWDMQNNLLSPQTIIPANPLNDGQATIGDTLDDSVPITDLPLALPIYR